MGVSSKIRELRERAGITQEELAGRIGVTASAVGNYESGRSHPKEEVMYRLFSALDCEPNEIFEGYFTAERKSGAAAAGRISPINTEAAEHMEKYLALDKHGRELVDICTDIEYKRSVSEKKSDGDMLLIAARNGGAPHKVEMRERAGAVSILDMPDYKGGN